MILLASNMQLYKHSINNTKQLKERKKEKSHDFISSSSFVFSHPPSLSLSPSFFSFLT